MAKTKERDFDTVNDGSHAIRSFTAGDFLIIGYNSSGITESSQVL